MSGMQLAIGFAAPVRLVGGGWICRWRIPSEPKLQHSPTYNHNNAAVAWTEGDGEIGGTGPRGEFSRGPVGRGQLASARTLIFLISQLATTNCRMVLGLPSLSV
jgi:hypothetical protein